MTRHIIDCKWSGDRLQKDWYNTIMRNIEKPKSTVKKMADNNIHHTRMGNIKEVTKQMRM